MSARRFVLRLAVSVGLAMAFSSPSALAAFTHPFISSFGSFSNVQGVAIDQSTGDVYVLDTGAGGGSLLKFDSAGNPSKFTGLVGEPTEITGLDGGGGAENEIAVDNSGGPAKGDIYVAVGSSNGDEIDVFSPDGTSLGTLSSASGAPWGETCGVAVDPSGDVYVGVYSGNVDKFVPSANPVTNADYASSIGGASNPCNVAVDAAGNVFAAKYSSGPVTRYEPSQLGSLSATGSIVDSAGSTLAVDSASGRVYVDEHGGVSEYGAGGEPLEKPLSTFGSSGEGAISESFGVAVNDTTDDVYVSDGQGKISVFGPGAVLADVSTAPASEVTETGARLAGVVNPEGIPVTSCQFEYGTEAGVFLDTAPCSPAPGQGTSPVTVSAALVGLAFGRYHYRLSVTDASATVHGQEETVGIFHSTPAGPTGLPDGRVYEQVSPANKFGNEVLAFERAEFVAPSGQAVMYAGSGALSEAATNSAIQPTFVSERTAKGWTTRSALPLPYPGAPKVEERVDPGALTVMTVPSADLSHVLFDTFSDTMYVGSPDEDRLPNNVYLAGPDSRLEPEWVGRSLIAGSPEGVESNKFAYFLVAGGSPDLKTIYFSYEGELFGGASELYEYKDGVLSDAGVLPGGETSRGHAHAAAQSARIPAAAFDNQVSADGSRIFFTREDEKGTLELYARVTAADGSQSTMLVSQSQLPGHVGEPAAAGPLAVPSTEQMANTYDVEFGGAESPPSYVFAAPDGSHAFFQSTDRLTEAAPESGSAKTYDFDLDTDTLEYVSGITGSIVTVSEDGSSAIFEDTATSPFELDRWGADAKGGSVTRITQLPSVSPNPCSPVLCVGPVYDTNDGSRVVFSTESPINGFNDGGTHVSYSRENGGEEPVGEFPNREIFRYDAHSDELNCLSCPPGTVVPSSDATMSRLDAQFNNFSAAGAAEVTTPGNAISQDGDEVFFETRDALVPQDTNATSDVYEWQDGRVSLITSGSSPKPSYFAGVSETGGDVFFITAEGIAPGDNDGSYDMYDARIPRPGDNPPPEAVPCTGAVCQGPPSVPQLLGQPASEAFDGAGNLTSIPPPAHAGTKALTRAQRLARALKLCKRQKSVPKRKRCESQERHRYRAKTTGRVKQTRHRKGRGK